MATPRTVAFHTLGCKLNFSETSSIRRSFEDRGYTTVDFEIGADIYILNTCSVTDFADKKCRYEVRRALKYSPDAKIVVVGCYAQLKPQEIADIPGVDLVLGAAEKFNILNYIDGISGTSGKGMVIAGEVKEANSFVDAFSFGDRTRSFLKVQDGCDYKCTFCTIPQARGASRSDTVENVVSNAQKIAALGVKEIVLTGVNLGDFGNGTEVIEGNKPKKQALFIDLIKALDNVEGIERYRISSIEPNLLTEEIISFVAGSKKFVPHFHIPLQSGNDKILKAMRRRYQRDLYKQRVEWIKAKMPHCCIGVDVIVGFPGESDEDFMDTYQFINSLDISYLHVFTYSERANTPAIEMSDPVPMEIRRQRNEMLRILSHKKRMAFSNPFIGSVRPVLFEHSKEKGMMSGFTDNYIKVTLPEDVNMINQIADVKLGFFDESCESVISEYVFEKI
ncbi:MAG: tRNA (N(6)-L-threonylcarbamoyladenosine(37)-C(2))-methylthiotransferase MtaB [Saprospiraceae bacterium]|nr:tRNA (N(6)-L-threonylcarbamoyladenosine(37)-C(2))-methylthiotransferase MtaB [Saprospiraceae bacterium]MBP6566303.1 tRNA (N(6)-L-threonylcarbamoyladenosine(37)-C(2))-methylthiotransferase MtaB [Saprospiraceae bacterium]